MRRSILSACCALALLAGCDAGKAPVEEDFSDLANLDEKSDAFSYRMKLLGSLDYGQTSADLKHTGTPRFRAYKFGGQKGDKVDIHVRSSNGGDAVAWLVNNKFDVIAYNDDAAEGGVDSHIVATLPGNSNPDIITYMIIYREYSLRPKKFSVQLDGTSDFFSCQKDADCVAVNEHKCCPDCTLAAVNKDQAEAYSSQPLICPAVLCPLACRLDQRVAQCNTGSKKCEMVEIADIKCGGHTINPHACPDGYECKGPQMAYDAPGSCEPTPPTGSFCGGIAGFPCPAGQVCIDNPDDDCDPALGGADCGGLCQDEVLCSGITAKCAAGYKWSTEKCNCVPQDCRDTGCAAGSNCQICWLNYACIPDGAVC